MFVQYSPSPPLISPSSLVDFSFFVDSYPYMFNRFLNEKHEEEGDLQYCRNMKKEKEKLMKDMNQIEGRLGSL